MFRELPAELELEIWKLHFKHCVKEIENQHRFRWEFASKQLAILTFEHGAYQHKHSELEEMMEDHNLIRFRSNNQCYGCSMVGYFPCPLCKHSYFEDKIPDHVKFSVYFL